MSMCSKFLFLVFKKFTSVGVLPITAFAHHVHAQGFRSLESRVTCSCKCQKPNSGPLGEQQMPLTPESLSCVHAQSFKFSLNRCFSQSHTIGALAEYSPLHQAKLFSKADWLTNKLRPFYYHPLPPFPEGKRKPEQCHPQRIRGKSCCPAPAVPSL